MRITVGRAVAVVLVLIAVAGAAWAFRPRAVMVEIAEVTRGRFVATVDDDGKTRIRERYVVAAPLAGRLTRVRLKAGDRASTGDVLASILPSPAPFLDPRSRRESEEKLGTAEAGLERAKAMVERAKAQSAQAEQELTRTRTLVDRGASTTQVLERADLAKSVADRDLRAAEFQFHAAQHEVDQTRSLLAKYGENAGETPESWSVTAPVTGIVLKVSQESETILQPGTPILELGDPRDIEVVVDVLSADAVEIRPGARVTIEHWGGPNALEGRVRRIEPAAFTKISTLGVEEQRVNVLIDVVSPPDQWTGLGDAYQIDARIVVFSLDEATIVPAGALFRRGDTWHVFTVENGRAQLTPVVVVRRAARSAAIASGLAPGQSVIVYPNDQVAAGIRVQATAK